MRPGPAAASQAQIGWRDEGFPHLPSLATSLCDLPLVLQGPPLHPCIAAPRPRPPLRAGECEDDLMAVLVGEASCGCAASLFPSSLFPETRRSEGLSHLSGLTPSV